MLEDNLYLQLGLTVGLFVLNVILRKIFRFMIFRHATRNKIIGDRPMSIYKFAKILIAIVLIVILAAIWQMSFEGFTIYFASFFTVAGIGLFASWSILSNITASLILFFYYSHRIGDRIRILDGEDTIEGVIQDIGLFNMRLEDNDKNIVTYPNNLALQKAIIVIVSHSNDEGSIFSDE